MSPASSGRYQSRLFNFIHQQSRRVREQSQSAFRHLQVATSWGVQVLLYPVYLLFQSNKLFGKQLHSAAPPGRRQLQADDTNSQPQTPPTADTPIQRVLLLVDALPSEEAVSNSLAFFASNKLTRLNPSPTLQRPVIQGIATQLASRTLVLVTTQNEVLDILTAQQQETLQQRIIEEVANYWRYQRLAHSIEQRQNSAIAFLDRTIADLETHHLAPISEATLRIQALIWAAIDYFFGGRRGEQLGQTAQTDSSLELSGSSKPRRKPLPHRRVSKLPSRPKLVSADLDPWLTLGDLFGDSSSPSVGYPLSNLFNRFQGLSPQPKQASGQVLRQKKTKGKAVAVSRRAQVGEISNQPRSQSTQLDSAPEWIETHATAMGYVKHPLEQLLAWLDRAMLWLEELLMSILRWVQQLLRGK